MTETAIYAEKLERKLIDEFKQNFQKKIGYQPIVLTRVVAGKDCTLPILTLKELEEFMEGSLPIINGKKLKLTDRCRKRELVELRNIFCALARMMRYTYTAIASYLGGFDHTSIMHNLNTYTVLMETDEVFKQKYFHILNLIKTKHELSTLDESDKA